jgi:lipopolysaccharide/colanic/teichoic acid biosynthesis glycosyltransferase
MAKRILDILGAAFGLALFAPFFAVIAVAIKATSPGPVFFRQDRLGLNRSTFRIYKFRSMAAGREKLGCLVTAGDDGRITRLGAFMRRHKVDELPQLINVLKGEMSLVGPRPEVKEFADAFPREYDEILTVKPGITHRATLMFRNEEEILAGAPDPVALYLNEVMPLKLSAYRSRLRQNVRQDIVTILATLFPRGRGVFAYRTGRLESPGVSDIRSYQQLQTRAVAEERALEELA